MDNVYDKTLKFILVASQVYKYAWYPLIFGFNLLQNLSFKPGT